MATLRIKHLHPLIDGRGGPAGYLSYFQQALSEAKCKTGFEFEVRRLTPAQHPSHDTSPTASIFADAHSFSPLFGALRSRVRAMHSGFFKKEDYENVFDCDLLFIHNVYLAGRLIELWPSDAREKVVLVTHTPKYLCQEIACDIGADVDESVLYDDPFTKRLVDYEVSVMNSVRSTLWPCPQAQEGYEGWFQRYLTDQNRTLFAETCVPKQKVETSPAKIREEWGIEPDQQVILFLGRPHKHKGFDLFVRLAELARELREPKWVFIHGGPSPRSYRDLSAIRHVGYVSSHAAAYQAADVVLVPNTYTYFDLGVLEALSIGANLLVTPTGGQKHLIAQCSNLRYFDPTTADAVQSWNAVKMAANDYGSSISSEFVKLWENHYSLEHFVANYERACQQLIA